MQSGQKLGQQSQLPGGVALLEEGPDRRGMSRRSLLEPLLPRLREHRIGYATIRGAGLLPDQALLFEPVQQACDAGCAELQLLSQVDPAHAMPLRAGQHHQSLIVVDRQPM